MSLFKGRMRQYIPGHKELTAHKDVLEVLPGKKVFIPLYTAYSTTFELLVKEGEQVFVGTKLAVSKGKVVVPIYSSVSGTFVGEQKMMHHTLKPQTHLVIENDEKYESIQVFQPLDYQNASREELLAFMMNAGIVGYGGAGFPTYIKYQNAEKVEKLIINAVECEPYITSDFTLLPEKMDLFVTGVLAMKKMAQALEVVIAVKNTYPKLIQLLETNVANIADVRVVGVPNVYPMGWERTLVYQITKKRYDQLPLEVGAIVNNVTTVIAFAHALVHGKPMVERVVTVSGDGIQNPSNVRVRIGTPVREVVEACGGYTSDEVKLIAGGPMMGKTIVKDEVVIDCVSNAITVLKPVVERPVACFRCGQCSDHCPSGLQPVRIVQASKAKDKKMMERLHALDCVECGLCTYVCPSRLDVTENVRIARRQLQIGKK